MARQGWVKDLNHSSPGCEEMLLTVHGGQCEVVLLCLARTARLLLEIEQAPMAEVFQVFNLYA